MRTIKDVAVISQEVLRGEVFGSVKIYNVDNPSKLESSAQRVLAITYPTQALRQALKAAAERLAGERAQGTFIFAGGYGTGKSHSLLAIYHLLTSPEEGRKWLAKWGIDLAFPPGIRVVVSHLLDEDPEFAWEPIMRKLGRDDLLAEVRDHPSGSQIRALLEEGPLVIILDELESWYVSIEDATRRERNLNFLQNLTEAAEDPQSDLVVFASLYGRNQELLGRLGRERIFLKDLGLAEDKVKVVLFRLFEEINRDKARPVVDAYLKLYADLGEEAAIVPAPLDVYRNQMLDYYPLHPELVDVLFQTYSACKDWQNTRGIIYLLSGVLRRWYGERDLLLPADVDPSVSEVHDDLYQLGPQLLARALEDMERTKHDRLAKAILATILLYSFVPEMAGAEESQVILGCLRPELQAVGGVNEIYRVLGKVEANAWYLWRTDGKYVIRIEENLPVSINARAARALQEHGPTDARLKIGQLLAEIAGGGANTFIYPLDQVPDSRQLKIVVSTHYLDDEALREEFYRGREWRNSVIFVRPKTVGDLAGNESLLLSAQRLLVCEQMEREVSKELLPQLKEFKQREESDLKGKLRGNYGEWMKPVGRGEKIYFLPKDCNLNVAEILKGVKETYGAEVLDEAILTELEEAGERGKRFDELRLAFLKLLGKPILVEPDALRDRVRHLCNHQGRIVMERGKVLYHKENPAPVNFAEDVTLYATPYGPAPAGEVEIEKREEERGEVAVEVPPGEKPSEVAIKQPPPGRWVVIKTQEHATPFSLQTDVEGRLRADDRVATLTITLKGKGLEEAEQLGGFLTTFRRKGGDPNVTLQLRLRAGSPLDKQEVLRLLDQLPVPTDGTVVAELEVEAHD